MKAYLINLDRNADRLEKATKFLDAAKVSFERFSAVDGRSLDDATIKKSVSFFRWWCCSGLAPTRGEIGCALSHLCVYSKILAAGEKVACIFEDDVIIKDPAGMEARLRECERFMPQDRPAVILLSNFLDGVKGTGIVEVSGGSFTEAYMLNDKAARLILRANTPINVPADGWIRWKRFYGLNTYMSLPAICTQDWRDGFTSDVRADCQSHARLGVSWYFKRFLGKMVDRVLMLFGL